MKKLLAVATALSGFLVFAGSASAADPVVDLPYDWTGAYAGLDIGWSWLDPNPDTAGNDVQANSDGVSGGLYLGYNWQVNQIVFGLEADGQLTDLEATTPCGNPTYTCNAGSDWNASIRARLGFAADRFLVYGTGGYAVADYNGYTDDNLGARFSDSVTLQGWTIGGGLEYAWTDNVLVRVEYRHSEFGGETMDYDNPYPVDPVLDQVMLGVALKF